MVPEDVEDSAHGHAEILRTDGGFALLRMHLKDRVLYSVVDDSNIVFLTEDPNQASHRFDQSTGHRSNKLDEDRGLGYTHNDYLETQPNHLPTLRGKAYRKLADQAAEWLSRHGDPQRTS